MDTLLFDGIVLNYLPGVTAALEIELIEDDLSFLGDSEAVHLGKALDGFLGEKRPKDGKEVAGQVGPEGFVDQVHGHQTDATWMGVAEVALAFIPVAFVVFAEHIADHTNLGTIINRDLINGEPGLDRTLLGDGVGSIVGTCFGVCPNTTYGESVGCIAISKNASVRTIFTAAIMLIILAFLSPITAVLRTIPDCVMGGVCLTLYGFIAVSGLKMFKQVDLNKSKNLFTVSAILIAGIGQLSIQIPYHLAEIKNDVGEVIGHTPDKAITITAIATALFLGIATYAICNLIEKKFGSTKAEEEAPAAAEEPAEKAEENK